MRIGVDTQQLAERAAALGCCSLTEFLIGLILDKALKILQEQ